MSKKYLPSNATEGDIFMADWCFQCANLGDVGENAISELCRGREPCPILGKAFAAARVKDGPPEWTFNDLGRPVCTAFVHKDDPERPYRCPDTADLFGS